MITLPADANVAALDAFVRVIRDSAGQDLRLPIKISRGGAFGLNALSVQVIATWARLHDGERRLNLSSHFASDESSRDRFASTLHGMSALYFADVTKSGDQMLKRGIALRPVAERVKAMVNRDYRNTLRGTGVALCCFEEADAEFLPDLYAYPRRGNAYETTVRSNADFKTTLGRMIDACLSGASKKLSSNQLEGFGNLVHQLFKNADVHTVTSAEGAESTLGVRGVCVRILKLDSVDAELDFTAGDNHLRGYLGKIGMINAAAQKASHQGTSSPLELRSTTFVELSVFDTGPGLALRWLSKHAGVKNYSEVTVEQELDAVRECFQLHSTTHVAESRGDGLDIAMRAMHQLNAFMFLRTGRLALVQDFSTKEHKGFSPLHRYGSRRLQAEVSGASYTICFPLPS